MDSDEIRRWGEFIVADREEKAAKERQRLHEMYMGCALEGLLACPGMWEASASHQHRKDVVARARMFADECIEDRDAMARLRCGPIHGTIRQREAAAKEGEQP